TGRGIPDSAFVSGVHLWPFMRHPLLTESSLGAAGTLKTRPAWPFSYSVHVAAFAWTGQPEESVQVGLPPAPFTVWATEAGAKRRGLRLGVSHYSADGTSRLPVAV